MDAKDWLHMVKVMQSIGSALIVFMAVSFTPGVFAGWEKINHTHASEPEHYLDIDSVKQMGPMAIYRQVHVLNQGPGLIPTDVLSKLSIHEYDCMNKKFRVLQSTGFSETWAKGEKRVLVSPSQNSRVWQDLPMGPLGQMTLDTLCPGGKDD